jgi:hypothetical protein
VVPEIQPHLCKRGGKGMTNGAGGLGVGAKRVSGRGLLHFRSVFSSTLQPFSDATGSHPIYRQFPGRFSFYIYRTSGLCSLLHPDTPCTRADLLCPLPCFYFTDVCFPCVSRTSTSVYVGHAGYKPTLSPCRTYRVLGTLTLPMVPAAFGSPLDTQLSVYL